MALHFRSALLPDGWARDVRVEIAGGRFAGVECNAQPQSGDELVSVALPGMCNVHSHGFQRGMAGLTEFRGPEADNFWSWRTLMYRFVARMTPEDIEAVTAQAYIEMLEGGFTRVGEFHYVHHDAQGAPYANPAETAARVAAAAEATGIGLTLLPVFYAQGGFGGAAPNEGQRRFVTGVDDFARLLDASRKIVAALAGANLGVAPHSLRAVAPAELARIIALAGRGPIHIHAAEQTGEVEQCLAWSGARPVQWLLDHAPVDERWCLVHATHMDEEECARLAGTGAVAGLCPVTEANLGDGIFPATRYLGSGGMFGIGTDSNVSIGVADELRQLEYSQRLRDRARNVVGGADAGSTGRVLFQGAVAGGARALGAGARGVAGIVAGAPADFLSMSAQSPALACREGDALLDTLVFAGGKDCIDSVWSAGRKVVSQGRHHAREAVASRYVAALRRLVL
ncbi:MAG TPA: formimidoylglutamate deiminase [Steroidobacteraceae bacterium]|nr:formimidoylglutamate deiminase [Steroidobacteraceae bacterium]